MQSRQCLASSPSVGMLRAAALLVLLAAALALEDTFLDKYAFTKVMEHCLGAANYYRQLSEVGRAKKWCLGLRKNTFLTTSGPNYYFSSYPGQGNQLGGGGGGGGGVLWDAGTLAQAAVQLNAELSNFTCVLEAINAIDEKLNVKQDSFVNHYYWTTPDTSLRDDLVENIYYCNEAANGLPLERDNSPLHASLHRLMFFLKCEKKKRLAACLKHDIRTNLEQYDPAGLPGYGSRSDTADQVLALLVGADGIKNLDLYY